MQLRVHRCLRGWGAVECTGCPYALGTATTMGARRNCMQKQHHTHQLGARFRCAPTKRNVHTTVSAKGKVNVLHLLSRAHAHRGFEVRTTVGWVARFAGTTRRGPGR